MLPIVVDPATHQRLFELIERDPDAELRVDLAEQGILLPGRRATIDFDVDPFAKLMLLAGHRRDRLRAGPGRAIAAWEAAHPPRVDRPCWSPYPACRPVSGTCPKATT